MSLKRRVCRERIRKHTMLSSDMRNLFVLATTCLAVLSLVRYCHFTNSVEGIAPSIHESLQVDKAPVFSRGAAANKAQNLVGDRQSFSSSSSSSSSVLRQGSGDTIDVSNGGHGRRFGGSSLDRVFTRGNGKDTPAGGGGGGGGGGSGSRALCRDRYVYIHAIPREYNERLLQECHILRDWSDMCVALSNAGLGPAMRDAEEYFTPSGWYETNQFALEVIFHNRMKQYDCLTSDASEATAIYVPFYAGLEASSTLWKSNLTLRDEVPLKFNEWLQKQPEWEAHSGHNHFMIGGRITWDFRRKGDAWGNVLLNLPVMQNMTTLVIEASTWDTNDIGIPYPTYFHPSSDGEILHWQNKVRSFHRSVLFSFAGGARNAMPRLIRGQIIDQCRRSPHCKLLSCDGGACQSPQPVMKLFEQSTFCLQPQGDSATRRSIFDSMLAGCIPVFFHTDSYSGYTWHFPPTQSEYSVFISEDLVRSGVLSIESVLRGISAKEIHRMRETIVRLVPSLVYADPRMSILKESTDAFGIAMQGVMHRISEKKHELKQQS